MERELKGREEEAVEREVKRREEEEQKNNGEQSERVNSPSCINNNPLHNHR